MVCAYWSESPLVKYRIQRRRSCYVVDRLEKRRRVVEDVATGRRKLSVAFETQRRFKVFWQPFACDGSICAEFYYLGSCQHTRILAVMHEAWNALQRQRLEETFGVLLRIRDVLRELQGKLAVLRDTLEACKSVRRIQGMYVLFTVDFLGRLPLRALVRILEAIQFPLEAIATEPLPSVLRQVCRFHQEQWANRPMLLA